MATQIEFFYDFGSPTTYLAWTQLRKIEAATGAMVKRRGILLGGIFKATENQSPAFNPAKAAYMANDLPRFAADYDVPFNFNPFFPINTLHLMRGALAADKMEVGPDYRKAVFTAMWIEPQNMGDPEVVKNVLQSQRGLDADAIFELAQSDDIKRQLIANTEEAVERGAFGAPTWFVGDEMFFGQDRIPHVVAAAKA